MKKSKEIALDFMVDKLTNSIDNVVTGDSFATEISILLNSDLKTANKKNGWLFNWRNEFKEPARDVYKLTIANNPSIVQGLISLEVKVDHVYMHLVESAPFNKGNISFLSKTQLVNHYIKTLGAFHFGGRVMIIETRAALKLIN
jgi:hypothetical protein